MATVTENTLKMTEGSDVYILRPMILSDKTFFTETMADFPYEAEGINPSRTFDKYMYQWAYDSQDSDLPVQKGTQKISVSIISKNDTPFCMVKNTFDYNCYNGGTSLYSRDTVVCIHPSQRGKGLYRKYLDIVWYWAYKVVKAEYSTYKIYDAVTPIKKVAKEKGWEYLESLPAGLQNTTHSFKNKAEDYSQPSQYTFQLTKATYDLTNERYATPSIQATYLSWDHGLT